MSNILSKSKNLYVVHTDGASPTQQENALTAHGLSLKINSIVLDALEEIAKEHTDQNIVLNTLIQSIIHLTVDLLTYPTLDGEDREHLLFNIVNQVKLQLNKDKTHLS
jgi:hypothetical protein